MKTIAYKWFYLAIFCLLLSFEAKAYDFKAGEIYYEIYKDTAVQVVPGDVRYTGNIIIPETVIDAGKTYPVTGIGGSAFKSCTDLRFITIPNSVTDIGNSAFESCGLMSVTIPNSVKYIGNSAFMNCTDLISVILPNSVRAIGRSAFEGCNHLTSITLPNGLTEIENGTFQDCKRLSSVTLGNGVTRIGNYAFYYCPGLTSIALPNSVKEIGGYAFYNTGLLSVTIPDKVTEINTSTFASCKSLSSVTIGNGVTDIGYRAFDGCSALTCVTIGSGVTRIGSWAFGYCSSLKEIHCLPTTPPSLLPVQPDFAFQGVPSYSCTLYVPYGCYNAYLNSDWKYFSHIDDGGSSVNALHVSDIDIYGSKGNIVVKGAPVGASIQIYSDAGQMIKSVHPVDDVTTIALSESGIYLVKIGNKTYKVRVL